MEENVFSQIDRCYDKFTKTYRMIADYTKENYLSIPFLSIQELSKKTGASSASISRFCQDIGYSGYAGFQKEIQRLFQKEMIPMKEIKNSISSAMDEDDILKSVLEQNIDNLKNTYSEHLDRAFSQAVELIRTGKRIYIIGLRSSYCVSYYLYFMLGDFMDNLTLLSSGTQDLFDRIAHVGKNDVLVAIGFEKYTRLTCDVIAFFRGHGCKIVALTDSQASPVACGADAVLIAKNNTTTFSFVSAMTILNAIVIGVGRKDKKKTLAALHEKEKILSENNVHI